MKFKYLLLALLCGTLLGFAQVPPNINSGNPNFPFPQFLSYKNKDENLGNLATQNAQGVPHAELELRTSDAYRHLCNNIAYTGQTVAGVRYMMKIGNGTGFPTPLPARGGDPCTCSEGDGYYLLATAYMADKITFDGLYMQMHDRAIRRQKRFIDGVVNENEGGQVYSTGLSAAGNKTSPTTIGGGTLLNFDGGSASDGDVDIALALLIAAKQWGQNSGIVLNANGWTNYEISYEEEARKYISALSDTIFAAHKIGSLINQNEKYYNCGIIGLDGYLKDGEKQSDITNWFVSGVSNYKGIRFYDKVGPAGGMYVDYTAPAYAKEWGDWFDQKGYSTWCKDQFYRAEASADWIMGKLYNTSPRHVPYGGHMTIDNNNNVTFGEGGTAEDARHPWRNLLNYVWHGNPSKSWNPVSHEVDINTGNTYQRDMGLRLAKFLANPQGGLWNNDCKEFGSSKKKFYGPATITWDYLVDGTDKGTSFTLNWYVGSSSPAAVIAQDYDLMAQMYRQCEIEWDFKVSGNDITGDPGYFHEWFRLLGMLVLTGNYHAPLKMNPASNLKVYRSINKTFAFTGDIITDTITYRNYGIVDATNSKIEFNLPVEFEMLSADRAYTMSGNKVVFEIGTVKGFKTGKLADTKGQIILKYKVKPEASGRYCPTADIYEGTTLHWTSNEYPNHVTEVMERNCVDIIKRSLLINKTVDGYKYNPGDVATYTIDFENSIDAGWLDGGRSGVTFSYAHSGTTSPSGQQNIKLRLWHDAHEPYIDYGNYRIAYYLNDATFNCVTGTVGCTNGWGIVPDIYEGGDKTTLKVLQEPVVPGVDGFGAWNQRISIQFASQLATTTPHLYNYYGMVGKRIHRGGDAPLRVSLRMHTATYAATDWFDDWSYAPNAIDADDGLYHPITPDWTDIYKPAQVVDTWHKKMCEKPTTSVSNLLIEEWDGYVWRRAFGNGPASGRDILNVTVKDTLPLGLTFLGFIGDPPLGINPTYDASKRIISWTIPKMLASQKGRIKYQVKVDMPSGKVCETPDEYILNKAWISASTESPLSSDTTIVVTCNTLPPKVTPSDLIKRIVSTGPYSVGSTVQYELEYTNKTGSIAKPNLNISTNWERKVGANDFTFGTGGMKNISNQLGAMIYGYSHGVNGTISGKIDMAGSANYGVVMRYTGASGIANGIYLIFKPNFGAGSTDVSLWNGATQMGTTQTVAIPTTPTIINFMIVLTGDRLDLYINNFTGTPLKTFTGLPIRAGYAGVINGNPAGSDSHGMHTLTSWETNLDSAFDLQFYDPVPVGVTFGTASNSGNLVAGVVTWSPINTTPTTPLLVGTTLKRSWTGTINACSGEIYNVAYLKIQGVNPDLAALATLPCGTPTPLHFIQFSGHKSALVSLGWTVATNESGGNYIIWTSTDNVSWNQAGVVKAKDGNEYQYVFGAENGGKLYVKVQYKNGHYQTWTQTITLSNIDQGISVVPNPFVGSFSVVLKDELAQVSLEIYNVEGKLMQEKVVHNTNRAVLGEGLPSGVYYLKVNTGDDTHIFRLISE